MPPQKKTSQALTEETVPPRRPDGAPDLTPWHMASRAQRAEFGPVLDGISDDLTAGSSLALVRDVEAALLSVALVPQAAKVWLRQADDADLMALFGWYMSTVVDQGESTASPAS